MRALPPSIQKQREQLAAKRQRLRAAEAALRAGVTIGAGVTWISPHRHRVICERQKIAPSGRSGETLGDLEKHRVICAGNLKTG